MSDEAPLPSRRNSNFYLDCVTFKVEDELFKIPIRCIAFDTEPFKTLASRSLPTGGGPVEGTSDEYPIILPDTSKGDFERLLEVLCPLNFKPKPITSTEVWESVLKLSTKWRLLDVRNYAIETMSTLNLSHGEMVRYGREYKVSDWLIKGYLGFATRESPLDEGDVNDILHGLSLNGGIHQLVRIATLRERKEPSRTNPTNGKCLGCNYGDIRCNYCGSAAPTDSPRKTMVDEGMVRTSFQVEVDEVVKDEKCFDHEHAMGYIRYVNHFIPSVANRVHSLATVTYLITWLPTFQRLILANLLHSTLTMRINKKGIWFYSRVQMVRGGWKEYKSSIKNISVKYIEEEINHTTQYQLEGGMHGKQPRVQPNAWASERDQEEPIQYNPNHKSECFTDYLWGDTWRRYLKPTSRDRYMRELGNGRRGSDAMEEVHCGGCEEA